MGSKFSKKAQQFQERVPHGLPSRCVSATTLLCSYIRMSMVRCRAMSAPPRLSEFRQKSGWFPECFEFCPMQRQSRVLVGDVTPALASMTCVGWFYTAGGETDPECLGRSIPRVPSTQRWHSGLAAVLPSFGFTAGQRLHWDAKWVSISFPSPCFRPVPRWRGGGSGRGHLRTAIRGKGWRRNENRREGKRGLPNGASLLPLLCCFCLLPCTEGLYMSSVYPPWW